MTGGFFVAFHSKCSEEFSRFFISEAESVLDTRNQTAESARFFFSVAESVLDTRNQTTDITKFFISEAETVLDTRSQTAESARFFISEAESVLATRNQTAESARFFISWDGFFLRKVHAQKSSCEINKQEQMFENKLTNICSYNIIHSYRTNVLILNGG